MFVAKIIMLVEFFSGKTFTRKDYEKIWSCFLSIGIVGVSALLISSFTVFKASEIAKFQNKLVSANFFNEKIIHSSEVNNEELSVTTSISKKHSLNIDSLINPDWFNSLYQNDIPILIFSNNYSAINIIVTIKSSKDIIDTSPTVCTN